MSIQEILAEVSKKTGDRIGQNINFMFGDIEYIKNGLSIQSKSQITSKFKFPLNVLFTPFNEQRGVSVNIYTESNVSLMFAIETSSRYTNEERLQYSFINILRPMYEVFLVELKNHPLIDLQYNSEVPHTYRERYDYGSRGVMDSNNKKANDLIDAIEIENLEIKVKKENCYGKETKILRRTVNVQLRKKQVQGSTW